MCRLGQYDVFLCETCQKFDINEQPLPMHDNRICQGYVEIRLGGFGRIVGGVLGCFDGQQTYCCSECIFHIPLGLPSITWHNGVGEIQPSFWSPPKLPRTPGSWQISMMLLIWFWRENMWKSLMNQIDTVQGPF